MDGKKKVLLVDDEPDIIEFIRYNLVKEGFQVFEATNGKEAIEKAIAHIPDVIILDVMMPGMDGIETCEEMRKIAALKDCAIAFLTARGEDYSQIAGFEAGADDYISKPIRPKVLVSRINALLKRYSLNKNSGSSEIEIKTDNNDLIINKEKYLVIQNGKELFLPKKEFELLSLMASRPDKVFTREDIYNAVWGTKIIVGDRTIDVHIRKLREKIGDNHIVTIKGVGYKFVSPGKRE
ncbi:MAG: response regulator transcription factor [Bacteroidales bacterium]|nr:response regulator transcription factor [Bacteroidales bacterium]